MIVGEPYCPKSSGFSSVTSWIPGASQSNSSFFGVSTSDLRDSPSGSHFKDRGGSAFRRYSGVSSASIPNWMTLEHNFASRELYIYVYIYISTYLQNSTYIHIYIYTYIHIYIEFVACSGSEIQGDLPGSKDNWNPLESAGLGHLNNIGFHSISGQALEICLRL